MPNILTIGGKNVADIQIGGKTVANIFDNTHSVLLWEKASAEPDYFYFEDRSGSANTLTLTKAGSATEWLSLEYSTDKSTWTSWDFSQSLAIAANGRVYLRGDSGRTATSSSNTHTFSSTGNVYAGGNAVTLVSATSGVQGVNLNHAFCHLFNGMTTLVGVNTGLFDGIDTVDTGTFRETFGGCSNLANVPDLEITGIAANASDSFRSCFYQCSTLTTAASIALRFTVTYTRTLYQMFTGCTHLVTGADIADIGTLGTNALQALYSGCTSLTSIEVGFDDWGDGSATSNWTRNINTVGTFHCPSMLPSTMNSSDNVTVANYIPYNWTVENI